MAQTSSFLSSPPSALLELAALANLIDSAPYLQRIKRPRTTGSAGASERRPSSSRPRLDLLKHPWTMEHARVRLGSTEVSPFFTRPIFKFRVLAARFDEPGPRY